MAIFLLGDGPAIAHDLKTSYSELKLSEDDLQLRVRIDDYDMLEVAGLDANGDDWLAYGELLAGIPTAFDFVEDNLFIDVDGVLVPLVRAGGEVISQDDLLLVELSWKTPLRKAPLLVGVHIDFFDFFEAGHKHLAKIQLPGKPLQQTVFAAEKRQQQFVVRERVSLVEQSIEFAALGLEHIFLGYDHVMFLLALIAVGGRLGNLIKIVTAFTVAHSITLCFAVLEVVALPGKWVEAGIALSIAIVALENFWIERSDHRWRLTFIFGLVHGFGFANVLRDVGLPTTGLVVSLLSFNIGVEIGQMIIVAVLFPLLLWLNRQTFRRPLRYVVSMVILLFAVGWFVERVFELSYMPI